MKNDLSFLTKELMHEYFMYKDGALYWKNNHDGRRSNGKIAGGTSLGFYWRIKLNKCMLMRSRLIFLMHHGYLPKYVDHIDRNKLNDRIENLRSCNASQSAANRKSRTGSSSKYVGVYFNRNSKNKNKYIATIKSERLIKNLHLGSFLTENEAVLAYNRAAVKYHGEFANLNIITP